MCEKKLHSGWLLMLLAAALLCLGTTHVMAQTTEGDTTVDTDVTDPPPDTQVGEDPLEETPEEDAPDASNPPPYMVELLENSELTQEQVDKLRANGTGWGNIRIAVSLAEQMVEKTADSDEPLTFDAALAEIMAARAEGKGFGEIAQENDLKIGQLMRNRNRNQVQEPLQGEGLEAEEGVQAGEAVQTRGKKRGLFSRLTGFLGFGKAKRPEKGERPVKLAGSGKPEGIERPEKPDKPDRPDRPEKPERPERPDKPEKPEKPERPARPEKPEKPERGPRR